MGRGRARLNGMPRSSEGPSSPPLSTRRHRRHPALSSRASTGGLPRPGTARVQLGRHAAPRAHHQGRLRPHALAPHPSRRLDSPAPAPRGRGAPDLGSRHRGPPWEARRGRRSRPPQFLRRRRHKKPTLDKLPDRQRSSGRCAWPTCTCGTIAPGRAGGSRAGRTTVIVRGRVMVANGQLLGSPRDGQLIPRKIDPRVLRRPAF